MISNDNLASDSQAILQAQRILLRYYRDLLNQGLALKHLREVPLELFENDCKCDGAWSLAWGRFILQTQKANASLERSIQRLFSLQKLALHVDWESPLSMSQFETSRSMHKVYQRQNLAYSQKQHELSARFLVENKLSALDLINHLRHLHKLAQEHFSQIQEFMKPKERLDWVRSENNPYASDDDNDDGIFGNREPNNPSKPRTLQEWKNAYYYTFVLVPALVGLLAGLAKLLNDKGVDDEGDIAQETANMMTCAQIQAASNEIIIGLIQTMLSGATGDKDELAIYHLLACLPTARMRQIVSTVGLNTLLWNFDGEEWDKLVILLRHHGMIGFQNWDDDASRLFINSNDPATLNSLAIHDICTLVRNMFSGSCSDDDELAILRLLSSIDCARVRQLVTFPGMSVDDFDDNVDGSEWDRLERLFQRCGIRV